MCLKRRFLVDVNNPLFRHHVFFSPPQNISEQSISLHQNEKYNQRNDHALVFLQFAHNNNDTSTLSRSAWMKKIGRDLLFFSKQRPPLPVFSIPYYGSAIMMVHTHSMSHATTCWCVQKFSRITSQLQQCSMEWWCWLISLLLSTWLRFASVCGLLSRIEENLWILKRNTIWNRAYYCLMLRLKLVDAYRWDRIWIYILRTFSFYGKRCKLCHCNHTSNLYDGFSAIVQTTILFWNKYSCWKRRFIPETSLFFWNLIIFAHDFKKSKKTLILRKGWKVTGALRKP